MMATREVQVNDVVTCRCGWKGTQTEMNKKGSSAFSVYKCPSCRQHLEQSEGSLSYMLCENVVEGGQHVAAE